MALWTWWLALFKIELFSHFNNLRAIGIQPIQSGIWEPVVRYSLKFERWSIIGNLRCHGLLICVWDKFCYTHNSSTIHKKSYTRNICVTRTCLTVVFEVYSLCVFNYAWMRSRTLNTCCSLHWVYCSLLPESLNWLIELCYICHMYPDWHTLRMSLLFRCSMSPVHYFQIGRQTPSQLHRPTFCQ